MHSSNRLSKCAVNSNSNIRSLLRDDDNDDGGDDDSDDDDDDVNDMIAENWSSKSAAFSNSPHAYI